MSQLDDLLRETRPGAIVAVSADSLGMSADEFAAWARRWTGGDPPPGFSVLADAGGAAAAGQAVAGAFVQLRREDR